MRPGLGSMGDDWVHHLQSNGSGKQAMPVMGRPRADRVEMRITSTRVKNRDKGWQMKVPRGLRYRERL